MGRAERVSLLRSFFLSLAGTGWRWIVPPGLWGFLVNRRFYLRFIAKAYIIAQLDIFMEIRHVLAWKRYTKGIIPAREDMAIISMP